MKPLGLVPIKFPGKVDHHIPNNINWWENIQIPNKARANRLADRLIEDDLLDDCILSHEMTDPNDIRYQ